MFIKEMHDTGEMIFQCEHCDHTFEDMKLHGLPVAELPCPVCRKVTDLEQYVPGHSAPLTGRGADKSLNEKTVTLIKSRAVGFSPPAVRYLCPQCCKATQSLTCEHCGEFLMAPGVK